MNEQQNDEFAAIAPQSDKVTFCGKEIDVVPLKVGQLPKFARALKGIDLGGLKDMADGNEISALFDLIADHGEGVIEAVSVATGIGQDVIEGAEIDELVLLASRVMRVNADFFRQRLVPAIKQAAQARATSGDGQTPSSH